MITKSLFDLRKPRDECAVFGVFNNKDASALTVLGLHALQHRGQDSTGIVSFSEKFLKFYGHRGIGQVSEVFGNSDIIKKLLKNISRSFEAFSLELNISKLSII